MFLKNAPRFLLLAAGCSAARTLGLVCFGVAVKPACPNFVDARPANTGAPVCFEYLTMANSHLAISAAIWASVP